MTRPRQVISVALLSIIVAVCILLLRAKKLTKPIARAAIGATQRAAEQELEPYSHRAPALAPASARPTRADGSSNSIFAPPRWHPRPATEWQGMLVNLNVSPPCESSSNCGLALACKRGRCLACEGDSECAVGESCVLDHCVRSELLQCRLTKQCVGDGRCVLSGFSATPRGNDGMTATCISPTSGAARQPPPPEQPPVDTRTHLPDDDLMRSARDSKAR